MEFRNWGFMLILFEKIKGFLCSWMKQGELEERIRDLCFFDFVLFGSIWIPCSRKEGVRSLAALLDLHYLDEAMPHHNLRRVQVRPRLAADLVTANEDTAAPWIRDRDKAAGITCFICAAKQGSGREEKEEEEVGEAKAHMRLRRPQRVWMTNRL